jgi:site-specific recombinase XerD
VELYEATKHNFGTYHINHGVSKKLLKEWFGHTSLKSTEIYAKIQVVDKFREIVGRKKRVVKLADRR